MIKKLYEYMTKDKDKTVRNDAKILEILLLNKNDLIKIKELINLLKLITLMGEYYI